MKVELLPSLLAADFWNLESQLTVLKEEGVKTLHIDVMDGMFVPSISFGMPVITTLRKKTDLEFDVHLMVQDPERYIEEIAKAGADRIGVHAEACKHLHRTLEQINALGKKAYVVLNPGTPLNVLDYVWDLIDGVLIMTVNPGFGGQAYIPAMTEKIKTLKKIIDEKNLPVHIQVDGGMKTGNVQVVLDAGADRIVAGSEVFGSQMREKIRSFEETFKAYEN